MESNEGHEGLLKIQILKLFNEIHDIEFLKRLHRLFIAKVTLDTEEHMFYNDNTLSGNPK